MHGMPSPSSPPTPDAESWHAVSAEENPALSLPIPRSPCPKLLGCEEDGGHGCIADKGRVHSLSLSPEEETARQCTSELPSHCDGVCGPEACASKDTHGSKRSQKHKSGELLHQFCHDHGANSTSCGDNTDISQPQGICFGFDADLEKGWGSSTYKLGNDAEERQGEFCRVCHLTVDRRSGSDEAIKLGCSCKDDLALAHRHCAETWFKIKGDRTCEICGSTATNIHQSEESNRMQSRHDGEASNGVQMRAERCWQNQPFCNMLLVCFIIFLIASWLFRATLF